MFRFNFYPCCCSVASLDTKLDTIKKHEKNLWLTGGSVGFDGTSPYYTILYDSLQSAFATVVWIFEGITLPKAVSLVALFHINSYLIIHI